MGPKNKQESKQASGQIYPRGRDSIFQTRKTGQEVEKVWEALQKELNKLARTRGCGPVYEVWLMRQMGPR